MSAAIIVNPVNPAGIQRYSRLADLPTGALKASLPSMTAAPAAVSVSAATLKWFSLELEHHGVEIEIVRNLPTAERLNHEERVSRVLHHLNQ